MQFFRKILSGMANSVHPDQTAVYTVCIYAILSETLVYEILGQLL